MPYDWNIHGICLAYAWHMPGISLAYVWHMLGICLEYAWHMLGICLECAWNMLGICCEHTNRHMLGICREHTNRRNTRLRLESWVRVIHTLLDLYVFFRYSNRSQLYSAIGCSRMRCLGVSNHLETVRFETIS